MSAPVLYEPAGLVGYVTLNRPDALNAMDDALLGGIAGALDDARGDATARVVVMRGAGRVFCAGGDVNDMPRVRSETEYRAVRLPIERAIPQAIRRLDKPLVAQIHGAAIGGGCVLAALCDLRIAAAGTKFGLPETQFGTTASLGGIYMLARIVGVGRAFELLYLGETFDADRAAALGLVNRVVPAADLEAETVRLAHTIAEGFTRAVALTRDALLRGLDRDFAAAADLETEAAMRAHLTGDIVPGFERARERMTRRKKK